jgi:hypothetical protein
MSRRPTIGEDPLDALIPGTAQPRVSKTRAARPPGRRSRRQGVGEPEPHQETGAKVRATFHLPTDLVEAARDTVVALSGPPLRLTLAALVEAGIRREIERLKKAENAGKPFPRRASDLRGGRPIGS